MARFLTLQDRRRTATAVTDVLVMRERREQTADFQQFYLEHVDTVRRVLARLLGPRFDVSDAIQDVFVVALQKRHTYSGHALASTWLHAIAQRIALATRRRARLRAFLGLDAASDLAGGATPQQLFEDREASELLYAYLDKLSEKKRTVYILYELEELSGEEIAEIVGCPLKTVWTRLYHARRELTSLSRLRIERSKK
jgi:RNA polymerase sigma-70 factor (ECF subfamily)